MPVNSTKLILLKLYELLLKETDEDRPISRMELCRRLNEHGVQCHVRTISRDIALLNESGYEVLSYMLDHEKYYYVPERDFSIPELKIMIDAIEAANFVTEKKTTELIDKIAALGGSYRRQLLKRHMANFNVCKHSNESILYNVDGIERAIQQKKKIAFSYFDLDAKMQRVYRTRENGTVRRYEVEPVALILSEDNYYLMAYNERYPDHTTNYRVDRMDHIEVIADSHISDVAIDRIPTAARYNRQAFKMHSGELAKVKLEFRKSQIAPMVDKFGEGLRMKQVGDDLCTAIVEVRVSKPFFGWLAQFGNEMRIVEPERIRTQYRNYIASILDCPQE